MDLMIFVVIVLVCLALLVWAVDQIPLTPPFNWILRLLIVVLAILLIINKAGLA